MHVLVAVLNWGLGHATRTIPVVRLLLERGVKVTLASDGVALDLLRQEFPQLPYAELPGYKVTYPVSGSLMFEMLRHLPALWQIIREEQRQVQQIVEAQAITHIISDNRYGCYSPGIASVIITHQLKVLIPKTWSPVSLWMNGRIKGRLQKFNQVWVPDFHAQGVTRAFTEGVAIPHRFVGMLSRFNKSDAVTDQQFVLGLISGPENQRSEFERILLQQFERMHKPTVIVRGLPNSTQSQFRNGVELIDHLPAADLEALIQQAEVVVARSGYSTIMDLYQLQKRNVIMVPTPGQAEQEHLAEEIKRNKLAVVQSQNDFDLQRALEQLPATFGFTGAHFQQQQAKEALTDFLTLDR
ncbi:MAG: hypothetical protein J0L66_16465 [Cytophagales bacterium]|nr:hypothetical protein [Cytophagales bacterium]